jgi:carbon-monoxide dehydrogenase medium subunit
LRPRSFEYFAPSSLHEALTLLSTTEDAKILAGGQSLITIMKLRLATPNALIDINGITELSYIREEDGVIAIGALTRHDQLSRDRTIQEKFPLLAEAASLIADQQVRNRGTIGGSLAHADPTADLPTACMALNANIIIRNENGSRSVASSDFFRDFFTTALKQDEIIQEVRIPIPPPRTGGTYAKLAKGHGDFALVAVATQTSLGSGDLCKAVSVVLGGVGSTPTHAIETEKLLMGNVIDDQLIRQGSLMAAEGLSPNPDFRATSELKLKMVTKLTERTLRTAVSRARGGI